jgi:hypothetical protein
MLYLNSLIFNCNCLNILDHFPYESSVIYNHDFRYYLKSYIETRFYKDKFGFKKKVIIHCDKCDIDNDVTELFKPEVYLTTNMIIENGYHHNETRFNITQAIDIINPSNRY